MMRSKIRTAILAGFGMLVLILDAKTALQGGLEGIDVCIRAVIPALLPFFVVSILLTASLSGTNFGLLVPLERLCRMPSGSGQCFLIGSLGGYPTGAQSVSQAYRSGALTREDAQRLLGFCSNAGPSFLFGIAASAFAQSWIPWALWLIHILSAIMSGICLPGKSAASIQLKSKASITLPQALEAAIKIMAKVCGWIILFRVILAFCDRWFLWLFPIPIRTLITGIFELANGCMELTQIQNTGLRFLICSCMLSIGGISVAMQTLSVTADLGFGMYLPGKILQTLFSLLLSYLLQIVALGNECYRFPAAIPLLCGIILSLTLVFLHKNKNCSRNSGKVIV